MLTNENFLRYAVRFPQDQIYDPDEQLHTGWNKVFGMSRTVTEDHHENSARWVSRCDKENDEIILRLGTYTYNNGNIIKDIIKINILPDKLYGLGIEDTGDEYIYYFKQYDIQRPQLQENFTSEEIVRIDKKDKNSHRVKRFLPPYFGGEGTAPHDMHLELIDLNYIIQ